MRFTKIAAALALGAFAFVLPAEAQTKKLVRIHTAGPADLGVDNTMLAHQFMTYVNANSDSDRGQAVPEQPARPDARGDRGDAPRRRRVGHHRRAGGVRVVRQARRRARACRSSGRATTTRYAVLDGPVGKELDADMEKAGFKVLSWAVSWGYRNVVTAKKEVKAPGDLKGLKIRTIPTKVFVSAINAMGANATPMNFGEIYTSLQSGVLDGYEHTAATTVMLQVQRGRLLHRDDAPPDGPDGAGVLAGRVAQVHARRAGGDAEGRAGRRPRSCARWRPRRKPSRWPR